MQRRQVLAALGSSTALALAGCLSGDPGAQDGTTTTTTTTTTNDDTTTTTEEDPRWSPGPEDPFETFSVGSREEVAFPDNNKAHGVRIWNDADEERTVSLSLESADGPGLDTEIEFPADGWVSVTVEEPATYTLTIAVDESLAGEVEVGRARFDCNASTTNVILSGDGEVGSRTISTLVGCPGPSIAEESFSFENGSCNMDDDALVSFEDETVEIEGSIRTPNPCYGLELASVQLLNEEEFEDGSDDFLEVTVRTTEQQSDMCTSCVGSVPYTATVDFEHDYPSNVRVFHESMGEKRTVTTVAR